MPQRRHNPRPATGSARLYNLPLKSADTHPLRRLIRTITAAFMVYVIQSTGCQAMEPIAYGAVVVSAKGGTGQAVDSVTYMALPNWRDYSAMYQGNRFCTIVGRWIGSGRDGNSCNRRTPVVIISGELDNRMEAINTAIFGTRSPDAYATKTIEAASAHWEPEVCVTGQGGFSPTGWELNALPPVLWPCDNSAGLAYCTFDLPTRTIDVGVLKPGEVRGGMATIRVECNRATSVRIQFGTVMGGPECAVESLDVSEGTDERDIDDVGPRTTAGPRATTAYSFMVNARLRGVQAGKCSLTTIGTVMVE